MNKNNTLESVMRDLSDSPVPPHLHGKIMKRVFFVGYGRYLYACVAILAVNFYMLADHAVNSIKQLHVVPLGTLSATALTAALCGYTIYKIYGFHKILRTYNSSEPVTATISQ